MPWLVSNDILGLHKFTGSEESKVKTGKSFHGSS